MTSWRTGNNRRRAKALKQGGLYTLRHGPTWAERGASGVEIIADIQRAIEALGSGYNRLITAQRPVVTTCPICRRPNPCPLHRFGEQVAFSTAREARR